MGIVIRNKDKVRPSPTDLGFYFLAVMTAMNREDTIEMHHIHMWPLFGPWKVRFRKELCRLS